jgi:hypothetical protein
VVAPTSYEPRTTSPTSHEPRATKKALSRDSAFFMPFKYRFFTKIYVII